MKYLKKQGQRAILVLAILASIIVAAAAFLGALGILAWVAGFYAIGIGCITAFRQAGKWVDRGEKNET